METIIFLAYTAPDHALPKAALESLGAARELHSSVPGSTLVVGLVGENLQKAADGIATCGASRFLGISGPDFTQPRYATDAAAAEALCKAAGATLVVAPGTSRWNRVLAGLAQRLGGRIDTHVSGLTAVGNSISINRWYYRQRIEASLQRTQRPWFILVDPGSQPAWEGSPGTAQIELVPFTVPETCKRTTVIGIREPASNQQTIRPDAKLLFVAGAGWTKKQSDGQAHATDAEKLILDC